jgi:hypothetical protein
VRRSNDEFHWHFVKFTGEFSSLARQQDAKCAVARSSFKQNPHQDKQSQFAAAALIETFNYRYLIARFFTTHLSSHKKFEFNLHNQI